MLVSLGLEPTAEKVYRALLAFPDFGVAELSTHLLVSGSQVREALDTLADLALLRNSREDPGLRVPVSLKRAMAILLERQQADIAARQAAIAAGRQAITDLIADGVDVAGSPDARVEHVLGLDAIQARLEELVTSAATEVMAVVPGGPQSAEILTAARPLDESLAARGVLLRSVYQDSMRADRTNVAYARWLTGLGHAVRTAPLVPPRMLLFDRSVAVIAADPDAPAAGIAVLREAGVLASLVALFEQTWDAAVGLDAMPGPEDAQEDTQEDAQPTITATERQLLKMLGSGMTDEAAAKRLGVSLRTVKRRMEHLMGRLDAGSRFQAGLKAGQRGWL
ncbi:DNA-binding CsgD family transcriptional regulator/sugar-specific transcriptional regulator TrmB [Catenulispora sp. GAS73]|uniref:helix-turn-helix transcriptional regulator n=1 Tax=Catenulispora sp. GAS73 TaxID=3156269 RepID=UPI00351559AF